MHSPIPFHKYQAAGNDFIVIDSLSPADLPPSLVSLLCHRHFGIGADGILLTNPPGSSHPFMIVLNADGSRPEMCANGLRCVALHHARKYTETLTIYTDAGPKLCHVRINPTPTITLDLGPVYPLGLASLTVAARSVTLLLARAGNPHAIFLSEPDPTLFDRLAPAITTHPFFPDGTNTSFATITAPNTVNLRVWERGVGPTLACGTAAAATATALIHHHLVNPTTPVHLHLPGGSLLVRHDPISLHTTLSGPAALVYTGHISPSHLSPPP